MQDKDKGLTQRPFIKGSVPTGAIISALGRCPIRLWLLGTIVVIIGIAGFLMVLPTATVNAAPEEKAPLGCLSCHVRVLKAHDKLGEGSKACWACHYNMEMGVLHLAAGETRFPLSDYPQLCAQCHQRRYKAWDEGTHGVSAWKEGGSEIRGTEKVRCAGCHDPHQPQIALLNITKPHPPSGPLPPPPSVTPLIILGISLLVVIGIGVVLTKKRKGS